MKHVRDFFARSGAELKSLRSLTLASFLVAIYAVSYSPVAGNVILVPGLIEFRFGFLAVAAGGMLFGPIVAVLIAVLGDLLGTVLFYGGGFFVGYTLNWAMMGFLFGCFFYKEKISLPRVIGAMTLYTVLVNQLMTTWCQSAMGYGTFEALFAGRLVRNLVMMPVNTVLLVIVLRALLSVYHRAGRTA